MTPTRRIQTGITVVALALASAQIFLPSVEIDATALTLLAVAAIPWLPPLFKSVELPGGLRLEFRELQAAEERAAAAGLLDQPADPATTHEYSFQVVADEDPNLALAGLRIEIERRLASLAKSAGLGSKRMSIGRLLRVLGDREILTREQRSVLHDMVGLLNTAAHGAIADKKSAQWALDVGPRLLATLEKRIEQ